MKTFITKLLFLLTIITLGSISALFAQVTIGSPEAPAPGAVLDLKTIKGVTGKVANSELGLGMPRVFITFTTPQTAKELAESMGNSTESYDLDQHVGLLIYNTNKCLNATAQDEGLYVWTGEEWQGVGVEGIELAPGVTYYSDARPQVLGTQAYPTRKFGTTGGTWMLENLRYAPADGSLRQGSMLGDGPISKYWSYPYQATPLPNAEPPQGWTKEQGFLYSFSAATSGRWDGQGNVPGEVASATATKVQGICPAGWHVPTDYDWTMLEQEIATNPAPYSTETTATPWQTSFVTDQGFRPKYDDPTPMGRGHGETMKSPCAALSQAEYDNGKSLYSKRGGFNVLQTGWVNDGGVITSYGQNGYIWACTPGGSDNGYYRGFTFEYNGVSRAGVADRRIGNSVRCKLTE